MKRPSLRSFFHALIGTALLAGGSVQGQSVTSWNFGTSTAQATPNLSGTDVLGSAVTQGNNNGTTTLLTTISASSGYTGSSGQFNAGAAARIGALNTAASGSAYFEFTLTPQSGATITVTEISFGSRSTGTGPQAYTIRSDADAFASDVATGTIASNSTWSLRTSSSLAVAFTTPRVFRIYGHAGTGSPSTGTANWRIDDLKVTTTSSAGPDVVPPTIASLSPADGGTDFIITANPVVTFSEGIQKIAGSGVIELRKADNSLVESFGIDDATVTVSGAQLTINPTASLEYSTSYYIVFVPTTPATALVEDIAGNDFTGLTTATDWNFTTEAPPPPPSVVINKFFNGTPDRVELLVIGSGVTGTTLDMRGMILKDYSGNGTSDNGGKFEFTTNTLWSAVPVGTLITVRAAAISADTTVNAGSGDFTLDVGLSDTTYFTSLTGSFDISGQEIVMIKEAGSGAAGSTGGIHALAATNGTPAPSEFDAYSGSKLLASANSVTGSVAYALNSTSSAADFNGTDATVVSTGLPVFGQPNNATNATYIFALRGVVPGDGSGSATLVNATPASIFSGINVFPKNETASQSAAITVTGFFGGDTIETVVIEIPVNFGSPSATVTVTGAGAGTPSPSVTGNVVTVSGLAITDVNSATITVNGLSTPLTTSSDNGNFPITVKTAKAGGTPTNIGVLPPARVVIPIEAVRDVNVNGVPVDLNTVVAVEGVCTEGNLNATNTLAFLQDGGFGVGVFNSGLTTSFVRGKRYVVVGTVTQFNGLTQINFTSSAEVFDLGADTEPAPLTIDIPTLLGSPETYEGRLIKIVSLTRDPSDTDTWATGATILMTDGASPTPNTLNAAIASGSGATTPPVGVVNITGIFTQNDTTTPFDTAYRISPREAADLESVGSGYSVWIDGFYPGETDLLIIGPNADPDGDGISNLVEAYTGTAPDEANGSPIYDVTKTGNTLVFFINQPKTPVSGLTESYQWSTGLGTWNASGDAEGGVTVSIVETLWDDTNPAFDQYQVTATITGGTLDELFVQLVVED